MKDPNRKPSDPERCCFCGGTLIIPARDCVQNGITGTVWCAVCGYRVHAGHDSDHGMATAAALRKYWRDMHEAFPNFDDPEPPRMFVCQKAAEEIRRYDSSIPVETTTKVFSELSERYRARVTVSNDPNDDPVRGSYKKRSR